MKKLLAILIVGALGSNAYAQCVPESDFETGTLELSTTPLEPVYACMDCGDHIRTISVQTFSDTTLSVEFQPGQPPLDVTVFADFFRLDSIGGLPEGLTYTTDAAFDTTYDAVENPFGYWVNPGDTVNGFDSTIGCISIEGSAADWTNAAAGGPNNDGVYPLSIYIDARAANFDPAGISNVVAYNTWLTDMGSLLDAFGDPNFTINGIKIVGQTLTVVESGVNVEEIKTFRNFRMTPNPAIDIANIQFSIEEHADAQVRLYSLDGRIMLDEVKTFTRGTNNFDLDVSKFQKGAYFLTVVMNKGSVTEKLIVQ